MKNKMITIITAPIWIPAFIAGLIVAIIWKALDAAWDLIDFIDL